MTDDAEKLPAWVTWRRRPFPDANLLMLHGRQPALVDSGFVGHAQETAAWVRAHTSGLALVVNTHWHADHVGGNALLQSMGAGVAASAPDAEAVARRDPAWLTDAAGLLARAPEELAAELVDTMLRSGAVVLRGRRFHAAAEHTPVTADSLQVPFPRRWPTTATRQAAAPEP